MGEGEGAGGGWASSLRGNSASEASTGPGGGHFCDSASYKSVSLHRVQEAFGISSLSVFKERLILAPQQSPQSAPRRLPG